MTLVAILTVRKEAANKFREFEHHAAQVMRAHGGRIERTIVVDSDVGAEMFKRVHTKMVHLREQSVLHTEILVGEDGDSDRTAR